MTERPIYILRVRPLADPSDVDGVRRLRSLLKRMLRQWRLQVIGCKPEKGQADV